MKLPFLRSVGRVPSDQLSHGRPSSKVTTSGDGSDSMQRRVLIYAIVIAASVAAIAGLLQLGETWFPASQVTNVGGTAVAAPLDALRRPLALLIIQLLVIVLATQAVGGLAALAGSTGGHRRDCRRSAARPIARRPDLAGRLCVSLSRVIARHPAAAEPGRRHPLHVQRRAGCRRDPPPAARADRHRRQPLQHRRSVRARRRGRARALSALCPGRTCPFTRSRSSWASRSASRHFRCWRASSRSAA